MGVWGAGNFNNDTALDYAHEPGRRPDGGERRLMRHLGISMVEAAAVEPGFKEERRKVIVETFDRLIEWCRGQGR